MSTPSIRRVSYAEILGAANAPRLIAEYAAECSVPDYDPQAETYAALERAGTLQCFGAYVETDLVGFVSVLTTRMPHNGKRVATVESLFVDRASRGSGAANALLRVVEDYASERECVAITRTARIASRLDTVLSHRPNCLLTHRVYTTWL